ncbi:MAG: hypothetical protein CME64_08055 [Halobacteriovoraceae bacterium]|nr:hypothetical protein [Halobacteriovoraceae bacterium]|tara:strand:- start:160066 stop:160944 length:879 start_codon:yes stop_codon:yes gene_type:complete
MEFVLQFANVSKNYGKVRALKGITLQVSPGEKVALLGSNGAGKSTFLSLASGLLSPSKGSVQVFKNAPGELSVRQKQTYLPQDLQFPENLKVKEVLSIIKGHYKVDQAYELIQELGLAKLLDRKTMQLSGGERRKLGLACTLLCNPEFAMLDEPTANIDVEGRQQVRDLLKSRFNNNSTLLFSSHEMSEVESLADRVVVLKDGNIIENDKATLIKKKFGVKRIRFVSDRKISIPFSDSLERSGDHYEILSNDSDRVIKEALKQDHNLKNIDIELPKLDEVLQKLWSSDETHS